MIFFAFFIAGIEYNGPEYMENCSVNNVRTTGIPLLIYMYFFDPQAESRRH